MLDPRIYRAAFAPLLLVLVVVAFSLQDRPRPVTTTLAPDAFDGARAFSAAPGSGGLRDLARAFPDRRPGGAGDEALARRIEGALRRVAPATGRPAFDVSVDRFEGDTADGRRRLVNVVAERAGESDRRIVVMAHRDALQRPATAELSGTAALLEIARVFEGRTLRRTLTLVSTSGGSGGAAGAARFAERLPGAVDAVLVLGDLAGTRIRKPFVVPWSNRLGQAPLALRRTVEAAVRTEVGQDPGGARAPAQVARLALPATVGEQGALGAAGLPAVMLQVSGERGPQGSSSVSAERIAEFGRAALRTVTALDAAPPTRFGEPVAAVVTQRKVLPGWTVRLLGGALILPVLLAAIDGFARVRRRREPVAAWLGWVAASALPFLLAAVFALLLALVGLLPASPPAPVAGRAVPFDVAAVAALASVLLVLVLGWAVVRPAVARLAGAPRDPSAPGAAAATVLALCVVVVGVWAANPFAAVLLLPALHLWTLVVVPEARLRRTAALALALAAALPVALAVGSEAAAFGWRVGELPWQVLLLVAGGHVGLLGTLAWCAALGCMACVLEIVVRRPGADPGAPAVTVRGPVTYAGPGSLGGTDSALYG